ncbi:hypothetical protein [Salinigranum sp. GCM10025319]|uniref:hypothetical protein n=1 Tax=Salinigranum sp. GCM10025319 TaxID=3252687 RepID=UPI0036141529
MPDWVVLGCRVTDASLSRTHLRTILIVGIALALTPALVVFVVLCPSILIDDPPFAIFEFSLLERDNLIRSGSLVVVLFISDHREEE